jgi:hypothetical protein
LILLCDVEGGWVRGTILTFHRLINHDGMLPSGWVFWVGVAYLVIEASMSETCPGGWVRGTSAWSVLSLTNDLANVEKAPLDPP